MRKLLSLLLLGQSTWVVSQIDTSLGRCWCCDFLQTCCKEILELLNIVVSWLILHIKFYVKAKLMHVTLPWLLRGTRTKWIIIGKACLVIRPIMVRILITTRHGWGKGISTCTHLHCVVLTTHTRAHARMHSCGKLVRWLLWGSWLRISIHFCHDFVETSNNIIRIGLLNSRLLGLLLRLLLLHLLLHLYALSHSLLHLSHHWVHRLLHHHRICCLLLHHHLHRVSLHLGLLRLLSLSTGRAH